MSEGLCPSKTPFTNYKHSLTVHLRLLSWNYYNEGVSGGLEYHLQIRDSGGGEYHVITSSLKEQFEQLIQGQILNLLTARATYSVVVHVYP